MLDIHSSNLFFYKMAREKIFRFKQFNVRNELSAMKVGTDGVLLGSWADISNAGSILDVGTGTGLIALMMAQRCNAEITAIEIDRDAAEEARLNFDSSSWKDRLHLINADFLEYVGACISKYDAIVSNPPYFINSMNSPESKRNLARHTDTLSYNLLIAGAARLLDKNGHLFLITPVDVEQLIDECAKAENMFLRQKLYVCPVVGGTPKRLLWDISKRNGDFEEKYIAIEKERHVYTDEYIELTHEYYINMP